MPRSEQELLDLIYRRSSAIRRRRVVQRGVSGFLAVGLIAALAGPAMLRGDTDPLRPKPRPDVAVPSETAEPGPATPTPCSCQVKPRKRAPGIQPRIGPGGLPQPEIPEDTVLAFASDRDGGWDIYRMRADGSQVRRLTEHPAPERNPAWSPDGTTIAFVRLESIEHLVGEIVLMNADGSDQRILTHGGTPKWSPDGRRLAFHRYSSGTSGPANGEIWVIDVDGSNERRVAVDALDPAWTADGRHLVFGGVNTDGVTNVTAVALDGSGRRQLTHNPIYACQPAVSPDGRRIAYIAADQGANTFHLAAIDWLGSGEQRVLTHGLARLESAPSWSPDGTAIAISRDPDGDPHYAAMFGVLEAQPQPSVLVVVAADGSGELVLSRAGAAYNDADPSFRPRAP